MSDSRRDSAIAAAASRDGSESPLEASAAPSPADNLRSVPRSVDRLLQWMAQLPSCAVAFSAGVDSTVVAKAAHLVLGDRALAVTADSPSLARDELRLAREIARQIGIAHLVIATSELEQEGYRRNDGQRCYHCKHELYSQLEEMARRRHIHVLLNGANLDDRGDYRPGMRAAEEFQVRSPLIECGLGKKDVREIAGYWRLPNWDKPAAPCLASRLAYGVRVTPERLEMVEAGERFLRSLGLREFRLRLHEGELARIEVESHEIVRLSQPELRERITRQLTDIGFRFVTLDLMAFRSGSLNVLVPVEDLRPIDRSAASPSVTTVDGQPTASD